MRRRSLLSWSGVAIVATAALTYASTAAAAKPLVVDHTGPAYDSFPDELCGISGTSTTRFVGNFKLFADGTFLSTGNFSEVFTADNGKQILNSGVEQVTGPFNPTINADGTITETFTFKGMPTKLKIPNGPVLERDAGNATVAITFLLNPDGSVGDFVSQSILLDRGPHPFLDNDALFCSVVTAALS